MQLTSWGQLAKPRAVTPWVRRAPFQTTPFGQKEIDYTDAGTVAVRKTGADGGSRSTKPTPYTVP
jgi:hypothetical protein